MPATRFSPPRGWFDKASVSGSILSEVSRICGSSTTSQRSHGAVWLYSTRLESDDDARKRASGRADTRTFWTRTVKSSSGSSWNLKLPSGLRTRTSCGASSWRVSQPGRKWGEAKLEGSLSASRGYSDGLVRG